MYFEFVLVLVFSLVVLIKFADLGLLFTYWICLVCLLCVKVVRCDCGVLCSLLLLVCCDGDYFCAVCLCLCWFELVCIV